jgi:predicted O-methyltransferase YrrM
VNLYADFEQRVRSGSDISDYLEYLCEQAQQRASGAEDAVLVELGVRTGNSTCAFLLALARACQGMLWSVDIAEPQVPVGWRGLPWWNLLVADDVSVQAQAWLPCDIDLLFIDTSHSYEHTRAELNLYAPRMRPGGLVLLHDTQWKYPDVALPEPAGPVAEAASEFCQRTGRSWQNRPGRYGLGIIRF